MSNAWDVLSPERVKRLGDPPKDKQRCAERLANDRCLLKTGHEGNHQVAERR